MRSKRSNKPLVLGIHTPAAFVKRSGWERIPLLDRNEGRLPPNLIVVGSRERVLDAADALPINNRTDLHELRGTRPLGRVNLTIGTFEKDGISLPLTILETQMGCSAQEINAKEVISMMDTGRYVLPDGSYHHSQSVLVIRAGTCGGINDGEEHPVLGIGDAVIGRRSYGWVGSVLQKENGPEYIKDIILRHIRDALRKKDDGMPDSDILSEASSLLSIPMFESSEKIVNALLGACKDLNLVCHEGANHTKDSLYMESDEDQTVMLRRDYGILSTEMEHYGLAYLAQEFSDSGSPVETALISTVVGTIPGGSFAEEGSKEETRAKLTEIEMLRSSAIALHNLRFK